MRVLVVTNMWPEASAPQRGRFVKDQVTALRELGVDVEVFDFPPGRRHYRPATRRLRLLLRGSRRFDLVHAHHGLSGWCAHLAGARPLLITFHGTDVRHRIVGPLSRRLARRVRLAAGVSRALFDRETGRPGLPRVPGSCAVLPCGPDLERFRPVPREAARRELGLDPRGRFLLFPADPARRVKRHDRARELAREAAAELLPAGRIDPQRMPLLVNAANAVLVTSDNEGFGLAALEALACDVPVLSTPVGIAPLLLGGVEGCLVAPFELEAWAATARAHLDAADPRIAGARRAHAFSARRMAERVLVTYRELLQES